jgi:transmembrane 9 superfamily protein 2/4
MLKAAIKPRLPMWIFVIASFFLLTSNAAEIRKNEQETIRANIHALRESGVSQVGHSKEAAAIRNYQLRKKKRKGLIRKREANLAEILFPGVAPELYQFGEDVYIVTDLVTSKKTHVPFTFYDLPNCPAPPLTEFRTSRQHLRKNLGARLQGAEYKPAPYALSTGDDSAACAMICQVDIGPRKVKWLRKLVDRQYRVHLTLDQLPVLMRSAEFNYAVRGYPLGFKAGPSYTGGEENEFFLYNHMKFTISYQEDPSSGGVFITAFDVLPVSIQHASDGSTCTQDSVVENRPTEYLPLRAGAKGEDMVAYFSYEVKWQKSELSWADRWDVYLIGSPDDDIHFFAIVNSLMIVLFLTGAIATIMVRALRKDISAYNEMSMLDDGGEETGWKLVHGDVFRPPSSSPLLLSVLVGAGAQLGSAFTLTMLAAIMKMVNPVKKGQTLTAVLVLYVLSGSVAGYISARIYKFTDGKAWKVNTLMTALGLPGILVSIFCVLNVCLSFAGAATAVSFLTLMSIFALWVCVSAPLVFVGSYFGFRATKIEVPTKINQIARIVPEQAWYATPPLSFLLGGILPFGSVCIELFFIMSALWLHQIYYVMGFLLAVMLILAATCAQVSIVMDYTQLCAEDHRWWWSSYCNCASAGVYLFFYSLWFLMSRLELVGFLPVMVYLTYMSMISLCFGLFCGSVGFLCAFRFNKLIYGAVKVD